MEVQTPVTQKEKQPKQNVRTPATRCTRSQATPDWTVEEMFTLVKEIIAIEGDSLKALSSYQKWKIISDNCISLGIVRSGNQCKRQWDSMFGDYDKIREWESQSEDNSYWILSDDQKKDLALPFGFDKEVYGIIRDFLIDQEDGSDSESLSESDDPIRKVGRTTQAAITKAGPKRGAQNRLRREANEWSHPQPGSDGEKPKRTRCKLEVEHVVAMKLKENCQHIDAVLQGEIIKVGDGSASIDLESSMTQTSFRRQQADELVKALQGLVSTLNEFVDRARGS